MKLVAYFMLLFTISLFATDRPLEKRGIKRCFSAIEQIPQENISLIDRLFLAIARNDIAFFTAISRLPGIAINALNENGNTPLMAAVINNRPAMVAILLSRRDLDPDMPDNDGITPLMAALDFDYSDIAEQLIFGQVSINHTDNAGNTPLMHAVAQGNEDMIELLLAKGGDLASINHINDDGLTVLMMAVRYSNPEIVSILINASGILINQKSADGKTALTIAQELTNSNRQAIIKLLVAHGAQE